MRMVLIQGFFKDGERGAEVFRGFFTTARFPQHRGQIVCGQGAFRMIGSEQLPLDPQRSGIKLLGAGQVSIGSLDAGQVVQGRRHLKMQRPVKPLPDAQRMLINGARFRVALQSVQYAGIGAGIGQGPGVIVSEEFAPYLPGPPRRLLGLGEAAPGVVKTA